MESKKAGDKTSNHIKLFDAINKMEEYDEDILKRKLKKETFVKHLSAEKRYLYQAILKSIRNFRGDQSIFGNNHRWVTYTPAWFVPSPIEPMPPIPTIGISTALAT